MGPLGIKPPRLRVALVAVLAALAAMAIASPGVASAAPSISVSCQPATVEPGQPTQCLAKVNTGSSTPATGKVTFSKGAGGPAVDLGPGFCQVQPESGGAGSCSLVVVGAADGNVSLFALYNQPGVGLAAGSGIFTVASQAKVDCVPAELVVEESTKCRVFIPEIPNSLMPPTGIVEWSVGGPHPMGEIDPECLLQPASGGASCSVTFTPTAAGKAQVRADYEGDPGTPARTVSGTVTVLRGHETITTVDCGEFAVTFSRPNCFASVINLSPKGPVPSGKVSLSVDFTDHPENPVQGAFPDSPSCTLQPLGGEWKQAGCEFRYEPHTSSPANLHFVRATYPGEPQLEPSTGTGFLNAFKVGEPTYTNLTCESVPMGSVGNCVITVGDEMANGVSRTPEGTVTISGSGGSGASPKSMEFGAESCELVPVPGMYWRSRCEIRYVALKFGTLTIKAEYQGNRRFHQVSRKEGQVLSQ